VALERLDGVADKARLQMGDGLGEWIGRVAARWLLPSAQERAEPIKTVSQPATDAVEGFQGERQALVMGGGAQRGTRQ